MCNVDAPTHTLCQAHIVVAITWHSNSREILLDFNDEVFSKFDEIMAKKKFATIFIFWEANALRVLIGFQWKYKLDNGRDS